MDKFIPEWESFFDLFPKDSNDARYNDAIDCTLAALAEKYRGPVQFKSFDMLKPGKEASDYVDAVTFRGGPVTDNQRQDILRAQGLADRRVVKKRSQRDPQRLRLMLKLIISTLAIKLKEAAFKNAGACQQNPVRLRSQKFCENGFLLMIMLISLVQFMWTTKIIYDIKCFGWKLMKTIILLRCVQELMIMGQYMQVKKSPFLPKV